MKERSFEARDRNPFGSRSHVGRSLLAAVIVFALLLSPLLVSPAFAALAADPGGPYEGVIDENVEFRGDGSTAGDSPIKYWFWNFGDGTDIKRDKDSSISHKYARPGTFIVRLRVVDDEGVSSDWAETEATIIDPKQTTTTTSTTTTTATTSTTTTTTAPPTTTTSTTTTTAPPTTTTIATTTTTLPTSTTAPPTTTTSTTAATPSTTTTTTRPAPTTVTTGTTTTTLAVLGRRIDVTATARGLSAISFSVAPLIVRPGDAITLDLELDAVVPGAANLLFLLDGEAFGEPAFAATGTAVSITRTLPHDLAIGAHRVEMVAKDDPAKVLASRIVDVIRTGSDQVASPEPITSAVTERNSWLAPGLVMVVIAAAAGAAWRYRRRWFPRRARI